MSNKENYMYGRQANYGIVTNKPLEREPYWDYMARRGAGGDSMKTTGEVYPVREDVPAELFGHHVAK